MATSWWKSEEIIFNSNKYEPEPEARKRLGEAQVLGIFLGINFDLAARNLCLILNKFYKRCQEEKKQFEVIFVSMDEEEKNCVMFVNDYHGDWLVLPWSMQGIRRSVRMAYNVLVQPALIIAMNDEEGTVISRNGLRDMLDFGVTTFDLWRKQGLNLVITHQDYPKIPGEQDTTIAVGESTEKSKKRASKEK